MQLLTPLRRLVSVTRLSCLLACAQGGSDSDSSESSFDDSSGGGNSSGGSGIIGIADPNNDDTTGSTQQRLRVTSYNVGLLPGFVSLTDERTGAIVQRLSTESSELLCLQEIWRPSDLAVIENSIHFQFPFSMCAAPRQKFAGSAPACTVNSFESIGACLLSQCAFGAEDFLGCAASNCRESLFELAENEPECAAALFAQCCR